MRSSTALRCMLDSNCISTLHTKTNTQVRARTHTASLSSPADQFRWAARLASGGTARAGPAGPAMGACENWAATDPADLGRAECAGPEHGEGGAKEGGRRKDGAG